ncbi:MAG TPA: mannose-6-phosphate isomerase, class I [Polyangiaceae bacterium]|nr:mannose-6-phosphate isomerase, class I [Polyangiaceae bacterium]
MDDASSDRGPPGALSHEMYELSALDNAVQNYAWGSRSFLAEFLGRSVPSAKPEAELWMGAHPLAPSKLLTRAAAQDLRDLIATAPEAMLGPRVLNRFGPELPYLMKVLAAAEPLSLQVHPSAAQAEAGFIREEGLGIPRTDPKRNYKDRRHKPELIVALTPFYALCGFRPIAHTRQLFAELGSPALEPYARALCTSDARTALRSSFSRLFDNAADTKKTLARSVETAIRAATTRPTSFRFELEWARRIADLYPGDVGLIAALYLNVVRLEPGQALYLPAGNLHAYLEGAGLEIMASSDNVLRGGLTPKHVDMSELLEVLDFSELRVQRIEPLAREGEAVYPSPAAEFRLSRRDVEGAQQVAYSAAGEPREQGRGNDCGPEVWLATQGEITLSSCGGRQIALRAGQSAFAPACDPVDQVAGHGTAFIARVPN